MNVPFPVTNWLFAVFYCVVLQTIAKGLCQFGKGQHAAVRRKVAAPPLAVAWPVKRMTCEEHGAARPRADLPFA
ncbi:MAG: hypothetical protein AB1586_00525 [Pseudomonadota bacterium]